MSKYSKFENGKVTPEYTAWHSAKARTKITPKITERMRRQYVDRGIKMHPDWIDSYQAFRDYIGKRPSEKYSLDRIDNDKGYEPGNVRWATYKQQANNRSTNRYVIYKNIEYTIADLADKFGFEHSTLHRRLDRFDTVEEAVETPLRKYGNYR